LCRCGKRLEIAVLLHDGRLQAVLPSARKQLEKAREKEDDVPGPDLPWLNEVGVLFVLEQLVTGDANDKGAMLSRVLGGYIKEQGGSRQE
jgi:hypothetical protein